MSISIDLDAIDQRLDHGALWTSGWGNYNSADGETCLHGAIRYCQPVPGDALLIEQVGAKFGFGTNDNDKAESWNEIRAKVPAEVTDAMLAETFGPQWEAVVALVRRAAVLTDDEAKRLTNVWAAAKKTPWVEDETAAWDAAVAGSRVTAEGAPWGAARDAAWALAVRDLIGQHGFTQKNYDNLVRPWASVIGPVHPDDLDIKENSND